MFDLVFTVFAWAIPIAAVLVALTGSFFTVDQQTVAIVERFGKFNRVAAAGLHVKWPLIERTQGPVNLRVRQIAVDVEAKTEDNVFVTVTVAVQHYILAGKEFEAFYRLQDAGKQIQAYVFDLVRSQVPTVKLDDLFAKKDEIADAVRKELTEVMAEFGYGIVKALVPGIEPDHGVKAAMNDINAAQRTRIAATEKGEAARILQVKAAEAESQSKKLQGEGIAAQRKAIVAGLKESVEDMTKATGTTAADVMQLLLLTQYFDTLKEIGTQGKATTIMIPHSPGAIGDIAGQLRNAVIVGEQVAAG